MAVLLGAEPVHAARYAFTNVAITARDFSGFGDKPAINNRGEVAFRASSGAASGGWGIYRYGNGTMTPLYTGFNFLGDPVINGDGTVAFRVLSGSCCPYHETIYRGNGGPLTTIADTAGAFRELYGLAINDGGMVAFHATLDNFQQGAYIGDGGPVTTVADTSVRYDRFWAHPAVDAAGNVYSSVRAGSGAEIISGNGGPITTLYSGAGFFNPGSNAAGTLAFTEFFDPCCGRARLVTGNGGSRNIVADTEGPFGHVGFGEGATINTGGEVAFPAYLDAGGNGVFTGPDPILDKVVVTGDPLFGSTVTSTGFHRGLNDEGDVVFYYVLANGISGISLARPEQPLPGDYNGDGTVDAADYVAWRKNDGTQEGYNTWRANFGATAAGVGAASRAAPNPPRLGGPTPAVPEPGTLMLALASLAIWTSLRCRR